MEQATEIPPELQMIWCHYLKAVPHCPTLSYLEIRKSYLFLSNLDLLYTLKVVKAI